MSDSDNAIVVKDLYKSFKLPHEQSSGIKQTVVNFIKRKKGYEVQQVLDDVSFDIKKGDFFGIVGRNGSGKSTLLKLLAGIYVPDKGLVQVNGTLTPFIELGVGFNPELTGHENVFLNGALLGFSRQEMQDMYDDIVDFAELRRFMDQKLKNYSSGMQVRLAFSIAIRAKTDILLLDEVLAVGDAAFQQKCYNYFEELKKEKKTVIFISHDMGAVQRFCTQAVYIDKGEVTHRGTAADIASVYTSDNLDAVQKTKSGKSQGPKQFNITSKVAKETNSQVFFEISYQSKADDEMYVGISVMKNGISVAEISTDLQRKLTGDGTLTYVINKDMFNEGAYLLDAALFRLSNRELLAFTSTKAKFIIKDRDITKGAALKLPDTWVY